MGRLLAPLVPLVSALVLLVSVTAPAHSATPEEEQAFSLYKGAAQDFRDERFEAALEKLEEAYLLFPKALILMKKAEALEKLGRVEEAHEAFTVVAPEGKKMAAKVAEALERLESALASPVAVSIISGDVEGARVFVDDTDSGKTTPTLLKLSRGEHTIRLEKVGYHSWRKKVLRVRGSNTLVVEGRLRPQRGQIAVRLSQGTFDDATVTIDGRDVSPSAVGATSTSLLEVNMGRHEVVCTRRDVGSVRQRVEVQPGTASTVICELAVPAGVNVAAWAMVGGGGALFAAGTTFLMWHLIEVDYARSTHQRLIPGVPHRDIIGGVLMGVGAGVGLASLIFFLDSGGSEQESAGLRLAPTVAPLERGGMVGLGGAF